MNDEIEEDPIIAALAANAPKDLYELREVFDELFLANMNNDLPEIGRSVDDVLIAEHEHQNVTVDVHVPQAAGPLPILIFVHGGGWSLGSPKTHRRLAFRFAEAGYLAFNLHYRLAPEYAFPSGYNDCVNVIDWVKDHAEEYGGDIDRIAMAGDSSSGNLTAAVAAHLSDDQPLKCTLLIYPLLDFANIDPSQDKLPGTDISLIDMVRLPCIGHDLKNLEVDPRVSPLHVGEKLPPTHILCGTADRLIDDCKILISKLEAANIPRKVSFYENMPHGFAQMEEAFPEARQSVESMISFVNQHLME